MRFHVVPKDGKRDMPKWMLKAIEAFINHDWYENRELREKQHRTAMQLMLFYGYTQAQAVAEVLKLNLSDE